MRSSPCSALVYTTHAQNAYRVGAPICLFPLTAIEQEWPSLSLLLCLTPYIIAYTHTHIHIHTYELRTPPPPPSSPLDNYFSSTYTHKCIPPLG